MLEVSLSGTLCVCVCACVRACACAWHAFVRACKRVCLFQLCIHCSAIWHKMALSPCSTSFWYVYVQVISRYNRKRWRLCAVGDLWLWIEWGRISRWTFPPLPSPSHPGSGGVRGVIPRNILGFYIAIVLECFGNKKSSFWWTVSSLQFNESTKLASRQESNLSLKTVQKTWHSSENKCTTTNIIVKYKKRKVTLKIYVSHTTWLI